MPVFICAVSTTNGTPTAYALVERKDQNGDELPVYGVSTIDRFADGSALEQLQDLLIDDAVVGRVTVVVQGGQRVAEAFHKGGLTTVPVETRPPVSRDGDTVAVAEQTIVDTFETVFRQSTIDIRGENELAERAIRALYGAMSDDAGAEDIPDHLSAEISDEVGEMPGDDANPDRIELSGSAKNLSTARVAERNRPHVMLPAEAADDRTTGEGLVDERLMTNRTVDMGDDHDIAMALGMAVWYGEYSADSVPVTDQAATSRRARAVKRSRQAAARAR